MARTPEIAAVFGTNNITRTCKDGDVWLVSGITGEVLINPTEEQIADFKAAGEAYAKQKAEWALLKDAKTVTADGNTFRIGCKHRYPKDVEGVNDNGAGSWSPIVQNSCTWILKTSQQKMTNTKPTKLFLKV